ncbi:MAG: SusC/RagA family TonB-linked outer membrane protein, partial [Sphingobacterium sp.]|nr:SusC/RagA family TonB-linked outer membrane protein [Sphingobacterium sp.]
MNKSNLLFHFLWFVPFLLLGMPHLSAQQLSQIRGTVLDHAGAPLPGVSIVATALGESKAATSSNARGEFVLTGLKADKSYGIHFTLIGYQAYEEKNFLVKAGDTNSILVRLHMTSSDLDEVVVIGYGNQKRGNLTTAISSLANVQKQTERPTTNIGEMLQGNIAGVTVMSTGGDPSANPTVLIRGMGTLSDESPLYVVDGVPYYGGPLNPNDIESIDIMKDAASAAIYGAQAASGVIAITTKSGKVGAPRFNIDLYKGWHNATSLPSALNAQEYARVYREAAAAAGTTPAAGHDPAKNPWGQETRTVWMDEIFQTGQITNLSAQVSGGSERSKYSTSFGYHDKEGLLKNTNYRRFTYRLKSEYDLSKRVQVGQNFFVNHSTSRGTNTSSSYSGSIINAIYMNPAAPVYDANGLFHGTVPFDLSGFSSAYGDTYNPVALLLRPTVSNPNLNLNGNAFIKVDIVDGLTFKSNFAVDLTRYSYKRFDPKIPEIGRSNSMNYLEHNERNTNRWIWDQQLNYRRSFGKHTFDALGVYSVQKTRIDDYTVRAQDFAREDDWYQYIGNAGRILDLPTSIVTEDALISAIGRI